jgi:HK97 family phage portal protein
MQSIRNEYHSGRKAISHRPDLAGRVHLYSQRQDTIPADVNLNDFTDYAKAYARHVWLKVGIKKVVDSFSVLTPRVVDQNNDAIEAHPLTELFEHGNDAHGISDCWAAWTNHVYLGGEAFLEVTSDTRGRPVELWPRRPDQIGVKPDLARPNYPIATGYTWEEGGAEYEADEIIHWKFDNVLNPWRGIAPLTAIRASLVIDIFAQHWSKSTLQRGGNPDVAVIAPQGITKTEREDYEATYIEKFRGWENWERQIPLILEDGVTDIKPLSWPPSDMQWLDQRKMARDEIAAILGVPDRLMGFGADTYDTDEKRKADMRQFWTLTLIPLINFRDNWLNTFWTKRRPLLRPNETIVTDLSSVDVLQEDIGPKVDTAGKLFSMGVPFNIIDERLDLGIGGVPGGDDGYLPINLLPAGSAPLLPPMAEQAALVAPQAKLLVSGRSYSVPEYGSIEHRTIAMWKATTIRPFEEQTKRKLQRFFQDQQNEVGRRLREANRQKQEAAIIPPLEDLFDSAEELERFSIIFLPILLSAFGEVGGAELELLLGEAAPEFLINSLVRQAINFIVEHHARFINDTTAGALRKVFGAAELEGASVPRMMEMLGELFSGRRSEASLERIARTVMGGAQSYATNLAWEQSGVVMGRSWLAALDNRVRDTHKIAHGQVVPLGGKYEVGGAILRFPRDPQGPPQEIINCRCDELAITFPIEQVA